MRTMIALASMVMAVVLSAGAADAAGTLDKIKNSGKIVLGYRDANPPMSFVEASGQPAGYSIDLCVRIAAAVREKLGSDIKTEFVKVTAENRLDAVEDGTIDILCGATTKTLSRAEKVDFSQLIFATGASLMSLGENGVAGVADLQGKKVAVTSGTTTAEALARTLKAGPTEAEVIEVASASEGIDALRSGKVDAFAADQVVLIGVLLAAPDKKNFVISTELFSFEPLALAMRRNDAEFRLIADRVIAQLYRSEQINSIYNKWFGGFSKSPPTAVAALYQLGATPE